jgi:hypothetical protein
MRGQVMGKDAAGDGVVEQVVDGLKIAPVFQLAQEGNLPPAKDLDPLIGKILVKAHYCPHGAVKVGHTDFPRQPLPAANTMEVQGIVFFEVNVNEVQYGKTDICHGGIIEEKRILGKGLGE